MKIKKTTRPTLRPSPREGAVTSIPDVSGGGNLGERARDTARENDVDGERGGAGNLGTVDGRRAPLEKR